MTKFVLIAASLALLTSLTADQAEAQQPRFGGRYTPRNPTISPYLNLLRGSSGGGIGSNYYQRVRPEQDFRNANRDLNQSVDTLRKRVQDQEKRGELIQSGLTQTGHVPRFMNLGGYFPALGRR